MEAEFTHVRVKKSVRDRLGDRVRLNKSLADVVEEALDRLEYCEHCHQDEEGFTNWRRGKELASSRVLVAP